VLMECIIETKATTVLEFIQGLRGSLWVTFEEGTSAAWGRTRARRSGQLWLTPELEYSPYPSWI
jgi:hypothetical protein